MIERLWASKFFQVIISTTAVLAILYVFFRLSGPLPLSVSQTTTSKASTFDVQAVGTVTAVPDTAEINLGIQVSRPTVQESQKEANSKINTISGALKKLGIEEKNIRTVNYSVYPNYDYSQGQKITGYNVNITLLVRVKDFDKINQAIDIATTEGANQVGGLNFVIDDDRLEQLKTDARKQAIEKAKTKAQQIANFGGLKLGKVVDIQENVSYPRPLDLMSKAVSGGAGASPDTTEIQPGESEVTVTITLSYETF